MCVIKNMQNKRRNNHYILNIATNSTSKYSILCSFVIAIIACGFCCCFVIGYFTVA